MKVIGTLFGLAAIAVVVAFIVVDVATAPTATTGQCLLDRRIILPDICVNSCTPAFDCTATARPYAFFFTQAATCLDGVIC